MIDVHSATWSEVRSRCRDGIEDARRKLETPMPIDETNIQRGRIKAYREIEQMGNPTDPKIIAALAGSGGA